jgi:ribosomal protein L40E
MMKLFGWKRPDQVLTYTHLSMKDVDEKDLVLHGLKRKEEIIRPIMEIQRCAKCGEENAPVALYCGKCGYVLSKQSTRQAVQLEIRRILREEGPQLLKELARETA